MSVMRSEPRTDRERLDEALRVNDQLSREIAGMKSERQYLLLGTYSVDDVEGRAVTMGEIGRTVVALTDAGVQRPFLKPKFERGRLVGFELVAVVSPVRPTLPGAA